MARRSIYQYQIGLPTLVLALASAAWATSAIAQQDQSAGQAATSGPSTVETYHVVTQKYALGDWGGTRTRLEDHGVSFDFHYVVDALSNTSGGAQQANTAWGRVRLTSDVDMEKLVGWKGATIHATGVWQYGANLGGQYIGSIANPSSLVSAHTLRMDSYWLEQGFLNKKLAFRLGQFAGQDFYGVREYGASFLAEPMGYAFGNLFTNVYESFDPASPPAAEIKITPNPHYYLKTAVLAGNRDPYHQDNSGIHFTIKNGAMWVGETGYVVNPPASPASTKTLGPQPVAPKRNLPGIYKVGAAFNNGRFTDPHNNVTTNGNYLIYLEGSQAITREGAIGADANRGLDLTVGVSGSPEDVSRIHLQWTAGARYVGAIRSRPNDEINLGFIQSKISQHFNTSAQGFSSEELIELNYRALLRPWLVFQPDFQYVVDPGALKTNPHGNAVVAGFRTKITF